MNWLSVFEVIESQVGRRQHLGHHDDLTRVHREVFSHVKHGFQHIDVRTLYRTPLKQCVRSEMLQDAVNVTQRRSQQRQQLATLNRFPLRKLRIPFAFVRLAADARNNPLPRVSAQMQDEVANAVRFLVRTPPNLFVR